MSGDEVAALRAEVERITRLHAELFRDCQNYSAEIKRLRAKGRKAMTERPPRLAVDANGYVWRVDPEGWSMVPTNPDNEPIPQPVTYYEPTP